MSRFAISLAVMASFILFGGTASASHKSGPSSHARSFHANTSHRQHLSQGMKFSHGYSFKSRQSFWSPRCWNSTYHCYCYHCSQTSCDYYWCQPYQCFYPVNYCPTGCYNYPEGPLGR